MNTCKKIQWLTLFEMNSSRACSSWRSVMTMLSEYCHSEISDTQKLTLLRDWVVPVWFPWPPPVFITISVTSGFFYLSLNFNQEYFSYLNLTFDNKKFIVLWQIFNLSLQKNISSKALKTRVYWHILRVCGVICAHTRDLLF